MKPLLLTAIQLQPGAVLTLRTLLPPLDAKTSLVGEIEKEQGLLPDWLTVKVWPATVIVPLRGEGSGLGATLKATEPLPEPGVPETMVMNEALEVALQLHPAGALTITFPLPPAELYDWPAGEIENAQFAPD
jgi:hypothetical protein